MFLSAGAACAAIAFFSCAEPSRSEVAPKLLPADDTGSVWIVPDDLLGRDFSLFTTVIDTDFVPGPDAKYGYPGDRFGPMILRFVRSGDILLLQQATEFQIPQSAKNEKLASLWEEVSYMDLKSFPILYRKDGASAVDFSLWLSDDFFFGLQPYSFMLRIGVRTDLPQEGGVPSYMDIVRDSSQITFRSRLHYSSIPLPGMPRDTSFWEIGTCLTLLPEGKMQPVYADSRVGYFTVPAARSKSDISIDRGAQAIRKFRDGVTFYLYPDFPSGLIPPVRRAVAAWDRIFAQYGLSVKLEEPTMEDVSSDMIRLDDSRISWIIYNDAPFNENAYGHIFTDLRTGEALGAHVGIFSGVDRNIRRWYLTQTGNVSVVPEDVYDALFEMVVTHEIGHTLGLEHNFYGSRLYSPQMLRDSSLMSRTSHGSSIMDYMRLNYAARPQDGIPVLDRIPGIGSYDRAAIRWGYDPGLNESRREHMAMRMFMCDSLRYLSSSGRDAQTLAEDLSSDPICAAESGMDYLRLAYESFLSDPSSADSLFVMKSIEKQYTQYVDHAISHIAAVMRLPDEHGSPVEVPVDSLTQAKAFDFIDRYVYNPPQWAEWMLDEASVDYVREKIARKIARAGREGGSSQVPSRGAETLTHSKQTFTKGHQPDLRKIYSKTEKLILETDAPGEYLVSAQIDSGVGLRCRPIASGRPLHLSHRTDVTDVLIEIIASDSVSVYGLMPRYWAVDFAGAECQCTDGGYLVRAEIPYGYRPEQSVVQMSSRTGAMAVTVSFHIFRASGSEEGAAYVAEEPAARIRALTVSSTVPDYYRKLLAKAAKIHRRRTGEKIIIIDSEGIPAADCPAAVSFDILDSGITSHTAEGFCRLNIGAGLCPASEQEALSAFLEFFSKIG